MSGLTSCLICGDVRSRPIFREWGVDVLSCLACGHVFSGYDADVDYPGYWDGKTENANVAFWGEAHDRMYDAYLTEFASEAKGRLLDVGCGLGFFLKKMQTERPGWETHGYEISPAAVRYGREELAVENLHEGRVQDSGYPEAAFDLITLWDVLEHLKDPDPLLTYLHARLRPGGTCFMHTPNVRVQVVKARVRRRLQGMRRGLEYLDARQHLHLYSPRTARILLERNGFSDIRFVHLPPIQHAAGLDPGWGRVAKNAWMTGMRWLDAATAGRVNLDNLFIAARRG